VAVGVVPQPARLPFSWIYKADNLAKDPRWHEKNVMGTGPFTFVEHVRGSHWLAKKNPNYWDKGKPYLDGYRGLYVRDAAAQVAALRAERAHVQFRGVSPPERDSIVSSLGNKVVVQESPWDCVLLVTSNHEKKPWDDKRVRRALTLALDRYQGAQALSRITIVKLVGGVQVPGTQFATPQAELEKVAGYGRDIEKNRAEAKRLLREAGVPDGFSFTFKNRGLPHPYEPVGVWLLDQWRKVGLNAKHDYQEAAQWDADRRNGNFEVSMDTQCGYAVEPDLDLYKFQSTGSATPTTPATRIRCSTTFIRSRAVRRTWRSARSTCASSRSASWTTRRTTCTRSSTIGSCRIRRS
jgi:peptide/nickel transport system substrate-binding protein